VTKFRSGSTRGWGMLTRTGRGGCFRKDADPNVSIISPRRSARAIPLPIVVTVLRPSRPTVVTEEVRPLCHI
jgi:hypothetical protein